MVIIKRLLIIFSCFLFIFTSANTVLAQEAIVSESSSRSSVIDYVLPYPGLLPDHPFYKFKVARDRLQGLLISHPIKKAEFDLLQADKRLQASIMLLAQSKTKVDLSVSTLSKANSYFEDALEKAGDAKRQGINNQEMLKKLSRAAQLYKEKIVDLEKQAGENKQKYAKERERVWKFDIKVKKLAKIS